LKELEDFRFLVRFPPHRQISATLISDVTYFKMKKEGVLVSLRSWNGDIEPYDELDEIWVQISGIPPRWSTWKTFRQIVSSLGNLLEVGWNSLFESFFGMVRVKVACKDASRIPGKRLFEMQKKMYLIHFKVEKGSGLNDGVDDFDGDDKGSEDGDDIGIEEIDHDSES
jgi:hypothetical protein